MILPYDSQISRQHASLSVKSGAWYIEDLGSRNGTYVDKQKIETPTRLEHGEMFRVGRTWLELVAQHQAPAVEAPRIELVSGPLPEVPPPRHG